MLCLCNVLELPDYTTSRTKLQKLCSTTSIKALWV